MQQLAADSLWHLTEALPSQAGAFPAVFDLQVWGSIIGMFELNNLGELSDSRHLMLLLYNVQDYSVQSACFTQAFLVRLASMLYVIMLYICVKKGVGGTSPPASIQYQCMM